MSKIQYTYEEINNFIQELDFVEITFDVDNIKNKTSKMSLNAFGRQLKFELIYINKKYDYYLDELDPIILNILDSNNNLMLTTSIEEKQDLLYLVKETFTGYKDLMLFVLPRNKTGLSQELNVDNIKNYIFLLFKV